MNANCRLVNPCIKVKSPSRCRVLYLAILAILYPNISAANPTHAQVISGQVSIDQSVAGVTTVTNSPNSIINWQDFNIAQHEITRFIQQNGQSAVLNRIVGGNPSEILGQLFSNGKVFLINPNGIIFGAGSQIDTQGLIASSLNLSNSDFQKGNFHFIAGSKAGDISNEGIIHAGKDGNIVLIAPNIENKGIIHSEGGKIVLAAGQELILTSLDNPEIRFQVQAPKNQVLNVGQLLTEGGAINVFAGSIKHSGDISADSVEVDKQGNIRLVAKGDVTLDKNSTISANNSKGDAGDIHVESLKGKTTVSGILEAKTTQAGQGGKIEILAENVAVLNNANVNASGKTGGGEILIGGDYQGKTPTVHNAKTTTISEKVVITADAKTSGKGGKVIVWSNNDTKVAAKISAKGGAKSGDGGFVETSGKKLKIADTTQVSTHAPKGKTGTWLLDPTDFTIADTGGNITPATLSTNLTGGNVSVFSSSGTTGTNGDVFVNSPVSWSSNNTLTLSAQRNIDINARITNSYITPAIDPPANNTKLALEYGQALQGGDYNVRAPINLPAGANFSTKLGAAAAILYTVINDVTALQNMNTALSGNFALGGNIVGGSITPIGGAYPNDFNGRFDGLGHTISNLAINATQNVGLFGSAGTNSYISNIGLLGGGITNSSNSVGWLAGTNNGRIYNSYATGTVDGTSGYFGGLVGINGDGGIIEKSYSTGAVHSSVSGAGGLVAINYGVVKDSYSSSNVTTVGNTTGGLVGYNAQSTGRINNSYATGSVTSSSSYVGGLVGINGNGSQINNSYSTGSATSLYGDVGGLVGGNNQGSQINNSYSTGAVSGTSSVGGLVGSNDATVSNSFWDKTVNSNASLDNGLGTGLTTAEMMTQSSFTLDTNNGGFITPSTMPWDVTNTGNWWMSDTNTRPFLRSEWSTTITNAHQLQLMSSNLSASYTLGKNLDLSAELSSASGMWDTGKGFVPVGGYTGYTLSNFIGRFDGLNHTITGLTIDRAVNAVGLFGSVTDSSSISNIGIVGGRITGVAYVGSLVGMMTNVELATNNYSTAIVSGSGGVGGLVGQSLNSSITNSYSTGNVSASITSAGGLIGENRVGTLSNSYSSGFVSGSGSNLGGLVGYNSGTITNSFWDKTVNSTLTDDGTGKTTADMMTQSTFTGFDFTNTWWMSDTNTRPFLRSEWSTNITNAHQLQLMSSNLSASYTLGNNLDLSSELSNPAGMWNTATGFVPVGNSSTPFTGSFDGQNYTISNLTINRPTTDYVGFFGYLRGTIENVGMKDEGIIGQNFVGGLAGFTLNSTISNSFSKGDVYGSSSIGGLVGRLFITSSNDSNVISNSYSMSNVVGSSNVIGGLVGQLDGGIINNSYSTGNVTGAIDVGGLVGAAYPQGAINSSYSSSHVSSSDSNVGGLVGYAESPINNSYAIGSVVGNSNVGGLVGYTGFYSVVDKSYSTGSISGSSSVGGLTGFSYGTITNSFWHTQTSGQATSAGGTGLTTVQMNNPANFTGFDFGAIWSLPAGLYPRLQSNLQTSWTVSGVMSGFANKTISYALDGTSKGNSTTDANGKFSTSIPYENITLSSNLLVWLSNDGTNKAVNFTNGSYLTDLKLELNTIYGQKDLDTSALKTAKGNLSNTDIPFSFDASTPSIFSPTVGILKANNDILLKNPIATQGGSISLKAGKSVLLNTGSSLSTSNGNIQIIANADTATDGINNAHRDVGQAVIEMQSGSNLDAGLGVGGVAILLRKREPDAPNTIGAITLTNVTGGNVNIDNSGTYNSNDAGSGNVVLNGSILTNLTGSNKTVALKASQNILLNASSAITTSGGAVTLNSDADVLNGGGIHLFNSSTITTGGGAITLAGGTDSTSYAQGYNTTSILSSGIVFGDNAPSSITLTSAGGNITMRGKSFAGQAQAFPSLGVFAMSGTSVDSGSGKIVIDGISQGTGTSNSQGIGWAGTLTSASPANDAITLTGSSQTASTSNLALGVNIDGAVQTTAGGGIGLTGIGGTTTVSGGLSNGLHLTGNVLANSGAITLTGTMGLAVTGSADLLVSSAIGQKAGTSSSSNIILNANTVNLTGSAFQSSGALTIQPRTAVDIGIANGLGTLQIPTGNFTGFSNITIGNATAGKITLGASGWIVPTSANLTFQNAADIALNGSLTLATGNTLTLNSTGNVTQSAPITATNLSLLGGGNYTLTNINNAIETLAANSAGSLSLINSSALIIDTVNSISGISASGAIDIATYNGNLTVNRPISTTNTTSSALRLNAGSIETTTTDANIIVGASGSFSVGANGIAKFFTGSIAGTTGLSTLISAGNFRYNSDESVSNYTTPTTAAGKYAIYREQPKLRVTPNITTSIYGDALATLSGSINTTDAINGDTPIVVGVTGTPTFNTTAIEINHVGNYDVTYTSGYSSAIGYGFVDNTIGGEYSITARTLIPTLTNTSATKIYDGTTNAPLGFTPTYSYSGFATGDSAAALTFSPAVYNSKNVGTATQLTISNLVLSSITGTGAITDYVLDSTSKSVAAGITAAALNITATGIPKIYDGLTTAQISWNDDRIAGDNLTLSHSAADFTNKNVGTAKPIAVSGITLAGTDAGNYSFNNTISTTADITAKTLAISAIGIPKIYDGLTIAQISLSDNRVSGDSLTVSSSAADFTNKNVGAAKPIAVSGITLAGTDAGNYSFNTSATTAADITAKTLAISATGIPKIYDGLTTAQISWNDDRIAGDSLTVSSSAADFTNKNVGTAKPITISGITLAGTDAGNYTFNTSATTAADITAKTLAISAIGIPKIYDGLTTAQISWNDDRIAGDNLTLSHSAAEFTNKNVGTAKPITVSGISLAGTDAGNYTFNTSATTAADITAKTLAISATGIPKIYDGLTTAQISWNDDRIAGDNLTLSHSAAEFTNKNVGIAKPITVSGITLVGTDSGNYTFNTSATTAADITAKTLAISATGIPKIYDGLTTAQISWNDDRIAGDNLTLSHSAAEFTNKNVGAAKPIAVSGITLAGTDAGNYSFNTSATTAADITAKTLAVSAIGIPKIYDGLTTAQISWNDDRIAGDNLTLSSSTASFADKNVGIAKPITVSGISLAGTDAGNYTFNTSATTAADITAKTLAISATGIPKIYDGLTTAQISWNDDRIAGDNLTLSHSAADFTNKNVGIAKPITVSGITLAGTDAGNYRFNNTTSTTADITAKTLAISAIGIPKIYDGLTTAQISWNDDRIAGDSLTVSSNAAEFTNKNVGIAKPITVSGITLAGTDAGNYTFNNTSATTAADITAKTLAISATGIPKIYDGLTTAQISWNDDRIAGDNLTLSHSAAEFTNKNVGAAKPIAVSGISLAGTDAGNYTFNTSATTAADITAKALAISAIGIPKIYDGLTAAQISWNDDRIAGDNLTLSHSAAEFTNKNVGAAKPIAVSGITLAGIDAGNYTFNTSATTAADITAKALAISATGIPKIYDGLTIAQISWNDDRIAGDNLTLSHSAAEFTNKNVGTAKPITVSGISLAGTDAGNYTFNTSATTAADITAKTLAISATGIPKIYDGLTTAQISWNDDRIAGDNLTLSHSAADFTNKNVGTAKPITISGITLAGTDAGNYTFNTSATTAADITAKTLAISATGIPKIYDGLTIAQISWNDDRIAGDSLTVSSNAAEFTNKNVGTAKPIAVSGITLVGTDSGNYTFNTSATTAADITAKTLAISAIGIPKIYDGLTTAQISWNDDRIAGDNLTLSHSAADFTNKNVGAAKPIAVSGITLAGTDAGNYSFNNTISTTADITAKALAISATGIPKIYDGLTTAQISWNDDRIAGDSLTVSSSAADFTNKNVGAAKPIAVSGITLAGIDAGNYSFNNTTSTTADITAKTLAISAIGIPKIYDGLTIAQISWNDDRIVGDSLTVSSSAADFTNKNVGTAKPITISGISLAGTDAGNYTFNNTSATTAADITAKTLAISATGIPKIYDGLTIAQISWNDDRIAGDSLTLSHSAADFTNKNVGIAKPITVSGITLAGTDAGNYSFNNTTSTTADITAKALAISAIGIPKIYDGLTIAQISWNDDRIAGDSLTVSSSVADFTNKNVGTAKLIAVSGISLAGTDAGNYTFNNTSATTAADITAKALAISATGIPKIYDGLTIAQISWNDDRIAGDSLTLSHSTASFTTKNVGTAKPITVSGITLAGTDAGNYSFNTSATTAADITAKTLAISAIGTNKIYDGFTTAQISWNDDRISGDNLTVSSSAASFANKNVGIAKPITVSGITLAGTDAGNYTFNTSATTAADITAKTLAISATGIPKIYDGLTAAQISWNDDRISGDNLTVSSSAASFANKNVGIAKPITISGITLAGTDASNYTFNTSATTTADITAKTLAISATGSNKIYDGFTAAQISWNDDRIAGDNLTLSSSAASFANKNVGIAKPITVSGITLAGADAGNYTFNNATSTTADITAKTLAISANSASKTYGESDTIEFTYTPTGLIGDDSISGKLIRTEGETVKSYDINSQLDAGSNYTIDYRPALFTINRAQNIAWIGGKNSDWINTENWNQGVLPDENQNVTIQTNEIINVSDVQFVNSLTSSASLNLQAATLEIKNDFSLNSGSILQGNGTVITPNFNNTLGGGISPGHSPGNIKIDGNYEQRGSGFVYFEMAGDSPELHDHLDVTGNAILGGILKIAVLGDYKPSQLSQSMFFSAAGKIDGKFEQTQASAEILAVLDTPPQLDKPVEPVVINPDAIKPDSPIKETLNELLKDKTPEEVKTITAKVETNIDLETKTVLIMQTASTAPILTIAPASTTTKLSEESPVSSAAAPSEKSNSATESKSSKDEKDVKEKKEKKLDVSIITTTTETKSVKPLQQCK